MPAGGPGSPTHELMFSAPGHHCSGDTWASPVGKNITINPVLSLTWGRGVMDGEAHPVPSPSLQPAATEKVPEQRWRVIN